MALDTSKIIGAVMDISVDVDKVVALVTVAQGQTATDEAAAQVVLDSAATALGVARDKLAALLPPAPPEPTQQG